MNLPGLIFGILVYLVVASTLVGWAVLVAAVSPRRAQGAHGALGRRPLLCWLLGTLQLLAVALLLHGAKLLGLIGLGFSFAQLTLGLSACLSRLGEAVSQLAGRRWRPLGQIAAGGGVLFLAGGLPWIGWLLLLMTAATCVGAAALGERQPSVVE